MKRQDINRRGKLTHLTADDLFEKEKIIQVFSAKTGKWLGTITNGIEHIEEELPEQEIEIEKHETQLSLF